MIQSLRKTKWLALMKIPAYVPTQSFCIMSLRYGSTIISPGRDSRNSSGSISRPKSSPVTEVLHSVSSEKSKLVLGFLKDCGFSEPQIKSIVSRWPGILVSKPKKTLKPKLEFLLSKGISKPNVLKIVSEEPRTLVRSLDKHLIPLFDFVERLVGSEENAAKAVSKYPYIFRRSTLTYLESNAMKLQNIGVPKSRVVTLIVNCARAIVPHPSRFEEAVIIVKEMGFKPTDPTFGHAVAAIGWCSKVAWKGKMDLLRSYGLSDAEILVCFKRQPFVMMLKSENLMAKLNFFVKCMHWCPHKLVVIPHILKVSLEKRIIPRLAVLYALVQKGDVLKGEIVSVVAFLSITENIFVQKYVTRYQDEVPEVLDAHKGELKISGLHALYINTAFKKNEFWSGA